MSRKMRRQSEHERLGGLDDADADDDASDDAWYRTRTRETSQAMKRAARDMRNAGAAVATAASSEATNENFVVGTTMSAVPNVRMTIRG